MGCWNGTCGLTTLPITCGTAVKVFLIGVPPIDTSKKDHNASGSCGGAGYLMYLPFDAEYDDYGSVENIKWDWNTAAIAKQWGIKKTDFDEWIGDKIARNLVVYPPYGELAGTMKVSEDDDDEEEDETPQTNIPFHHRSHAVGIWIVRKDVWDQICHDKTWMPESTIAPRPLWTELQWGVDKAIRLTRASIEEEKKYAGESMSDRFLRQHLRYEGEHLCDDKDKDPDSGYPRRNLFRMALYRWGQSHGNRSRFWKVYQERFDELVGNGQELKLKELTDRLCEQYLLDFVMEMARKSYVPQTGAGDQSQNWEVCAKLATITAQVAQKEIDDWKRENGE